MEKIYQRLSELVGHTPLLRLQRLAERHEALAEVVAKVEFFNPGGSVKDRVALGMIEDAEQRGLLQPGSVIIEPTSGNTGVGLAWIGRLKGYETIIVMPETMSMERQMLLRAAGAQLVLTPGAKGMAGAIAEAERLRDITPGAVILGQFTNPANPAVHERTTGQEIWDDTAGRIDVFVAGVGTGGTVTGVGRALKKHNPSVRIIAVEPDSSAVLSGAPAGAHKIQGIGAGFVPDTYGAEVVDEVFRVRNEDAMQMGRELSQTEGLLVGISSGAAAWAAVQVARRPEMAGKRIVVLLPDTGERYLSTELFAAAPSK
ncbi:MAG: cysteine synthase A [Bacteroidaceae bacterium]|nr:cysteine synthase A [Bacteroidaceae bacterium]MBQ3991637.1 cysteine synthase A [Bacteroidaceae bacterium]